MRRKTVPISAQRGISMFEVLVTLGIITIWLLATAGVQSSSAKLNKTAQLRTEAVVLASEIAERLESNQWAAVNSLYVCPGAGGACALDQDPTVNCLATACDAGQRADFDQKEWGKRVKSIFGDSIVGANITVTGASPVVTYTIAISWRDRKDKRTYTSTFDETVTYTTTRLVLFDPAQATPQ